MHLPKKMLKFRDKYEHHLIIKVSDNGIDEMQSFLEGFCQDDDSNYFICDSDEEERVLLHRFSAGVAATRYQTIHEKESGSILSLDIALRRNDKNWEDELSLEIKDDILHALYYGHFLCNVFHQNYILKKDADKQKIKEAILKILDGRGAKYPAEHNVGHLYQAESHLQKFYKQLDPTNTFNPGVGKMSKYHNHCNCC
jgi:D-lactate dehydrogenase